MSQIAVIDYGMGNLLSVQRGLEHCGAQVILTSDPEEILLASRVVLPGVGAFAKAMIALDSRRLIPAIQEVANRGTPLLGICLGMQLLLDESEEFGFSKGLGIIPGRVVAIPKKTTTGEEQKIPHIGWNELFHASGNSWTDTPLNQVLPGEAVYFVHSFMAEPVDDSQRFANCNYGGHYIAAVIKSGQTIGCQFHPEKSGKAGLKILRSFCGE